MNLILIIISVSLTGFSQILFKLGMKNFQYQDFGSFIFFLMKNLYIIGGLILMMLGAVLWFYVLSKNDVSFAYPFVALSFLIVIGAGYFLGESITLFKIIGILLIIAGLIFISKS